MRTPIHFSLLASLLMLCTPASSAVPASLSYQAYLTDASGVAVDADTMISFAIYNVETDGAPLWFDSLLVPVTQGLMSVTLGSPTNPFPPGLFEAPLFIGITIDGDVELAPRRPLTTAGFSFRADDATTLQGQGPAAFDQSDHVGDTSNPHAVTTAQTGAATSADIASLQAQLDAALADIAQLQADLVAETQARINADDAEQAARILDVDTEEAARLAADSAQDATISSIQANSVLALDGILTSPDAQTALFTGVNVQVVSGSGFTTGAPNGTGNVIVGYDEPATGSALCSLGDFDSQPDCENGGGVWAVSHKSGSHNLVVGSRHNYSRFGGIVVGEQNSITGNFASISAGQFNVAGGLVSSVTGGALNKATGYRSSVTGGRFNTASGEESSVGGGAVNTASGFSSRVNGGSANVASGSAAVVSAGTLNQATGESAAVNGGWNNVAGGKGATVLGGGGTTAAEGNEAYSDFSVVAGGTENTAGDTASGDRTMAQWAFVGGGETNTASGQASSVTGGRLNTASNTAATVSGGSGNTASGSSSAASGGVSNVAVGPNSVVAGGVGNRAEAIGSVVSAGVSNIASGNQSTVSGGRGNVAESLESTVSGGGNRTVTGVQSWRAGTLFESN